MKLLIDIPKEMYDWFDNGFPTEDDYVKLWKKIRQGTPLEEIPNPCIECSQNCCVRELNGEKCECQKVYVVKENK